MPRLPSSCSRRVRRPRRPRRKRHSRSTGLRKDASGNTIPRKIINKFACEFNGKPVFTANMDPAIAANPYLQFYAKVEESGTFKFTWTDDDGTVTTAEEKITVA